MSANQAPPIPEKQPANGGSLLQLVRHLLELEADMDKADRFRESLPATWNTDQQPHRGAFDACDKIAGDIMRTERKIINLLKRQIGA